MDARPSEISRPLSVAPMMDCTDRQYRYFFRQISRRGFLYTEMITVPAILNGDRRRLLDFDLIEKPLSLQLGGDDPRTLAEAARIAVDWNYDEINLNVGCPSDRVQSGNFGACLMARPELVAECVAAMRRAVDIPITVKHRIGIDGLESYEDLAGFVRTVAGGGCERFIVHARIAILGGLSPKQNREVPPLRYEDVFRLKREFPALTIEINGGVRDLQTAAGLLEQTDGVMIGRAAYENPYLFASADRDFYDAESTEREIPDRARVLAGLEEYLERLLAAGEPARRLTSHILGLFAGMPGGKSFRRFLSEKQNQSLPAKELLQGAVARIPDEALHARPVSAAQV